MTRKEQIDDAVTKIVEERESAIGRQKYGGWYFAYWFKAGVEWADEHPKSSWQPMRADNLPPVGYDFVIMSDEGVTKLVHNPEVISYIPQIQNCEGTCWTHWMLIPKLEEE